MKVYISSVALLMCLGVVSTEPPVPNYSTTNEEAFAPPPPSAPSASYGPPSSSYGPPSRGRFGGNRHTTAVLRPSANYGAPSPSFPSPSASYGAPPSPISTPSASYGVPGAGRGRGGTNFFGGHGGRRPSTGYGVPSEGYNGGGYDDGSSEPASYQFSYHVQDAPSGNDFGHTESREGHVAKGMYMVLLPDGRRQIVEYIADQSGYHPTVRYEGTATAGGYPSGTGGGYRY